MTHFREWLIGLFHPAARLNRLAVKYVAQGRYAEAEPLAKRALEISEKAQRPNHRIVGRNLINLANLYRLQGRYGEAMDLAERSLAILK